MKITTEVGLDFNDVLIQPQRSTIKSRKDVSIMREIKFPHASSVTWLGYPVIAANMLTGTFEMARALAKYGMLTALHKHHPVGELVRFWQQEEYVAENHTFYTLGIRNDDLEKYNLFKRLYGQAPQFVCIDIANGHIDIFGDFVKRFRDENKGSVIMAGNVVTGSATEQLVIAGADIVKVGIGSGANCITRKIAGVGRPQLSAVNECAGAAHGLNGRICSDGGIIQPADVNIAFCADADFVMIGSMFSGTDECGGEIVTEGNRTYKKFFGMSSNSAMDTFGNGKESYKASEGRTTLVPCKGPVSAIVEELQGATKSMLSYIGASKLKEAPRRAVFERVNARLNMSAEKYTIGN